MSQSTLTRALMVMDEASKSADGLRFSDVQKLLGNPSPTTVNKILKELTAADALSKTREGRYVVGMKAYFWGKTVASRQGPMQVVRNCMKELHERFAASVNLFTCSGEYMLCLESITSPQSPSLWPAGSSLPIQLPVIGSVFFYPPERMDDESFLTAECARHDPTLDVDKVREMIRSTRETGTQFDAGLFYTGVYRMAVPIMEQGRIAMVLGLGVIEASVSGMDYLNEIATAMDDMKQRIERNMYM
ncbi:IclR family transcriptional regulator domain-containing protein [Desulfovibrio oxyclinae]|uniref:IclR family transcriptional regulator domain-containing protein n=1 Tax=Desulfovibrio oxyclinae TaxID=63560 RepID=UPI0012EA9F90|nr:transcriptional regulator, IclR family protein [Desulfovibrio oxyclinae]